MNMTNTFHSGIDLAKIIKTLLPCKFPTVSEQVHTYTLRPNYQRFRVSFSDDIACLLHYEATQVLVVAHIIIYSTDVNIYMVYICDLR